METRAAAETPTARTEPLQEAASAEAFSWTAHPARQRPAQAVLAVCIVCVVAGFVYVAVENAGFAILGAVLLTGALNRFFFPSRFTLDGSGISAAYPLRRMRFGWSDVRRFVWDEYGGYISTRAAASRLDAYRGMHLLFDEPQRDRIIARIRDSMKPLSRDAQSKTCRGGRSAAVEGADSE